MWENIQTQPSGLFTDLNQDTTSVPVISPVETISDNLISSIPSVVVQTEPVVVAQTDSLVPETIQNDTLTQPIPELKTHIWDAFSLQWLSEFSGINLWSLIQSASSVAVSPSVANPWISAEGSKTKKMILIWISVVGFLLLLWAWVRMMSVMDPLSDQKQVTDNSWVTLWSEIAWSGSQSNSQILTTGSEDTGIQPNLAVDPLQATWSETDPTNTTWNWIDLWWQNNQVLIDEKQISAAINEKMKAAYEVAKTAKTVWNTQVAKKALLAYGLMKKMLAKLESWEYTSNDQAMTELSELQSQVDQAVQSMNQ